MTYKRFLIPLTLLLTSCASTPSNQSLYEEFGGKPVIETVADNFVVEIGYDKQVMRHFQNTNIDRFRNKFVEHLCVVLDGPCEYTGDSMEAVHKGMNITESDFNRIVDLIVNAMDKAGIEHPVQNKVLNRLAKLRHEIIYR